MELYYRMLTQDELNAQPACQETLINRLPCNRKAIKAVSLDKDHIAFKTLCAAHFQMWLAEVTADPDNSVIDDDNQTGTSAEPVGDLMIREAATPKEQV